MSARRRAAHTRAAGLVLAAAMMISFATSHPGGMRTSPVGSSFARTVAASSGASVAWWRTPTWLARLKQSSWWPMTAGQQRPSTPAAGTWRALVRSYPDWNPTLMVQIAWCESRYEPWVVNPVTVWVRGEPYHSTGLFGQLVGPHGPFGVSNPTTAVRDAHALYEQQGYGAWQGDFSDGCAYG